MIVFDSSRVPEPFLDSALLEKIRKRQKDENLSRESAGNMTA